MKEKRKTLKLNFNTMLVAFSVVPMMISIIIMLIMLISTSSAEIKGVTQNSMLSLVKETGTGFESYIKNEERTLKNFAKSPIVVEFLKNQTDAALQKEAQDYTMECFNAAGNMEAIYISNWDSTTLTHPVEKAIGVPTREGDRLKSLQENMLASDDMYNTGIIASPATGKQVVSMYAPVFDDKNNPIGYVGAAVYVNDMAEMFSDTSSMGYDSMYFYTVNGHDGIMIQHPNEEKVGQPVENEAVKQVLARISNNEEVEPGFISYVFDGKNKYAAYFVGKNNDYITVLTVAVAPFIAVVLHTHATKVAGPVHEEGKAFVLRSEVKSEIEVWSPVPKNDLVTAVDQSVTIHVLVFQITWLGVAVDDSHAVLVSGDLSVSTAHHIVLSDEA